MTYELAPPVEGNVASRESSEYRRTHFRVYDENGFASTFMTIAPENATLLSVLAHLVDRFRATGGKGYDSKDLVVLLGPRIVAVVRSGRDGDPKVTIFED
jgi:hypothetical protein